MISKNDLLALYDDWYLYDLENDAQPDIDFWRSLVEPEHITSFLELCCGTGRIALELLRSLDIYHGVDLSASFLSRFREKIRPTEKDVRLIEGDIRTTCTNRTYDVVAIPFNSLSHVYSSDQLSDTLANVRRHLADGGVFALDVHNPSLILLTRNPEIETVAKAFVDPRTGREVTVYERNSYDCATQINHIRWRYVADSKEIKHLSLPMRMYFPAELDACLECHGFRISEKYGSFDREPFVGESMKQIYLCNKGH